MPLSYTSKFSFHFGVSNPNAADRHDLKLKYFYWIDTVVFVPPKGLTRREFLRRWAHEVYIRSMNQKSITVALDKRPTFDSLGQQVKIDLLVPPDGPWNTPLADFMAENPDWFAAIDLLSETAFALKARRAESPLLSYGLRPFENDHESADSDTPIGKGLASRNSSCLNDWFQGASYLVHNKMQKSDEVYDERGGNLIISRGDFEPFTLKNNAPFQPMVAWPAALFNEETMWRAKWYANSVPEPNPNILKAAEAILAKIGKLHFRSASGHVTPVCIDLTQSPGSIDTPQPIASQNGGPKPNITLGDGG